MSRAFYKKCRHMGSRSTAVNILTFFLCHSAILPLLLTSLFMPVRAEAGVFSFITDIFSTIEVEAEEPVTNIKNLALLQATISPNQGLELAKGEIAIIGGTSLSAESQNSASNPNSLEAKTIDDDQISLYVVRDGDTLPAIAKMFGVSVNTIRWGNNLKGNTINVGQTLVILPISGIQHIVKLGDTILSIAKMYKGDVDEILQYNDLSKDVKLSVGDTVIVPDGEATTLPVPTKGGVGKKGPNYPIYEGYYMRPVIGGIKTQGLHGKNGIDIGAAYGTNILAGASGEVIISRRFGYNGGYGLYVVLKHNNGTQTLYAHMSSVTVEAGQYVSQGQVIGRMGSTGRSTGNHLHFEIRGARNPF